ncbi:MAG: PD40 domain-containing protein [Chloroflexi bacterium]|nr:PD40 domain-containing protein [Chloroflexota bacterium]
MAVSVRFLSLLLGLLALLVGAGCGSTPAAIPSAASSVLQGRDQPSGKLLYVREGNLWIWQDGESRPLTSGGTWRQPALSPSGLEIAYVQRQQNFADLFAMASDGSSSRRLTSGQAQALGDNDWTMRPAWSPDGVQIAYTSDANSPFPVAWLMNKDGSAKRQIMIPAMGLDWADAMSWEPGGKRLAVTAMGRDASQIYILDIARGFAERLTNHPAGAFDPAWSPDGSAIAYVGRDSNRGELRLERPDGSGDTRSDKLAYVRSPAWSPDGATLAVLSAQSGSFDIWIASVRTDGEAIELGEPRQLTRDGGIDAASGLSWGP